MRTPTDRTPADRGITHPLNVSYLVVGLVFLGLASAWALRTAGLVDNRELGWLLPLTLVGAGAVGLVAFAAKGLSRNRGQGIDAGDTHAPGDNDDALDDTDTLVHTDYVDDLERRINDSEGDLR